MEPVNQSEIDIESISANQQVETMGGLEAHTIEEVNAQTSKVMDELRVAISLAVLCPAFTPTDILQLSKSLSVIEDATCQYIDNRGFQQKKHVAGKLNSFSNREYFY